MGYVRDLGLRGTVSPHVGEYTGLVALYRGTALGFLIRAWAKTFNWKHLYPVEFSPDGEIIVTTTCCSIDQFMIIMRESDGSIIQAAIYP